MDKDIVKGFKALGEPTRLRILKVMSVQGMCVCEISEVLDILQPRVSQHLKILKEAELVIENKEGYWTFYSINKERLDNLWASFRQFLATDLKDLKGFEAEYQNYSNLDSNERVQRIKEKTKNREK